MTAMFNPDLDLTISRIIRAPRSAVWNAWTDPAQLEQWWIPAPTLCKVVDLDLRPGGSFVTRMSEDGAEFVAHISGSFLAVDPQERLVFTDTLVGGWRPSARPFMTAIITFRDHPDGTAYDAIVRHKDKTARDMHEEMGFYDGWGSVTEQLAILVETRN